MKHLPGLFLLIAFLWSPPAKATQDESYADCRAAMVNALADHGITDSRVLEAMGKVPRHLFVPADRLSKAYQFNQVQPLDVKESQSGLTSLSAPSVIADVLEALELKPTDRVLEVGTATGYQTALLAELVPRGEVFSVEIIPELAAQARSRLSALGYFNIHIGVGEGTQGWPGGGWFQKYDAIVVNAACIKIPSRLTRLLARGGRVVIPKTQFDGDHIPWEQMLVLTKGRFNRLTGHYLPGLYQFVPLQTKEESMLRSYLK